jgi:hypothetical protein
VYEKEASLGMWVNTQRRFHSKNKLRLNRKALLDELGFVWKARVANTDKMWHQQYDKVVEFKQTNGHCLVPSKYEKDASLSKWVNTQRGRHEIGFVWRVDKYAPREKQVRAAGVKNKKHDKYWHQQCQYGKLLEFKQTNGNALAARSSTTDVSCP